MSELSPKERLLRVFNREAVDRSPVICPGGMMNAAVVDVMNKTGHSLPEAHHNDQLMAELANDVHELTGFENIGIPFCLTVEAEVLGSAVDYGTLSCEPKIISELYPSVKDVIFKDQAQLLRNGRIGTVVQAGYRLSLEHPELPIIGNLTGPTSAAASIVDPITFLKELRKDRDGAHRVLNYVSEHLSRYARLMMDNGVNIFSIADPTATGEILGPKLFAEYAVPYLNTVIDSIHDAGGKVIVHICGEMRAVRPLIPEIHSDAISTDAMVNLQKLKNEYPQLVTMGNLSTFLLEWGTAGKVSEQTERLVNAGIDIISPACGLSTSTSLTNIQSMTGTVKNIA
ncbi:MAG TPA: uroporphyrinogen decarboxylase family protein [Negativicutes bacterium]|nr:uroporphyrinogen decarboxylase family protein [Negativicutes bacterium]